MNILILTGNFGMGHNSAANAIAERIAAELEDSRIYVSDIFAQTFKTEKYNCFFRLIVKYGKCLYNFMYRRTENSVILKKLPLNTFFLQRILQELVENIQPDAIISTLPVCSKVVSEFKAKGSGIPLITCITDVTSHCEWLWPNTDFYLVAAPKLKDELAHKGVDPQHVIVSGIPVRTAFQREDAETASGEERKLLIMGGGLGLLPGSGRFYEELNRLSGVKTTVITGNNKKLYNALAGRYEHIQVLAYIQDVPRYMKSADLLLTKPGGITVFEAMSAELPLLFFPPFLQQERKNGACILENHMGDMLPENRKAWTAAIRDILNDDKHRSLVRDNMRVFKSFLDENALLRVIRQYDRQCV